MANKQLKATVKIETRDAERALDRLSQRIKYLNKLSSGGSINSSGRQVQNIDRQTKAIERQINTKERQLQRELAAADKLIAKETAQLRASQQAKFKSFLKEEEMYQKQLQREEQLKQKELQREAIRQRSLKTLGDGDRASQRMVQSAEKVRRAEYEAWWQQTLLNQEQSESVAKLTRMGNMMEKFRRAVGMTNSDAQKLSTRYGSIKSKVQQWADKQRQVWVNTKQTNSALGSVWQKLKGIAATYLGVMGARSFINTSDLVTKAENKLNYVNGGDANLTQQQMDKIYGSSQRGRTDYMDMLSNVSKMMVLAGDSFQNSVDNATRFQEIMAKSYTVGGASAAEQASSMYQMVQALGSGILQGDELRSIREGAPLAYKAIEEFTQGVYKSEESLKELASRGVVTSDIVVAAILNSEDKINQAFNNTAMTFEQAWAHIKNMATKAFEPVYQMLNDALNSDLGQKTIDVLGKAIVVLGEAIIWIADKLGSFFTWFANNWDWLQWIVYAAVGAMIVHLGILTAQAIVTGTAMFISFLMGLSPLEKYILLAGAVISAFVLLGNVAQWALWIIAIGFILITALTGNWVALTVALIAVLAYYFFTQTQKVMGYAYVAGAWIMNVIQTVGNVFWAILNASGALASNVFTFMGNLGLALGSTFEAVCKNIGAAFNNAWYGAKAAFWDFVADCLDGMKKLEPAINALAKVFGEDGFSLSGLTSGLRDKASAARGNMMDYIDVSDTWNSAMKTYEYADISDAWNKGMSTYDTWADGWKDEAYQNGYQKGAQLKLKMTEGLDAIKNKLGLTKMDEKMIGLDDQNALLNGTGLGGAYDPSAINDDVADGLKKLGNIDDNTGSMADSMELSQEDLEYLRKIADMEWKKEFTTASIVVEMNNSNTINGESDLDGIVTKLSEKLYEELQMVADGVPA